jgi:type VI secretion system VgrG family protein
VVARVERHGVVDDLPVFRLRLVPGLWLLSLRSTSRIFQERSVPEIVGEVLDGLGIAQQWQVERAYPKRTYCVQYRESDLDFAMRLLAEEGIFYFFADPDGEGAEAPETVVFADSTAAYHTIPGDPKLRVRQTGALERDEHVTGFSVAEEVHSDATLLRAFDLARPLFDLKGEARSASAPALRVYEHDGDPLEGRIDGEGARTALEQLGARSVAGLGASNCQRLVPGRSFELVEHASDELDRRYVVVHVEHEVHQVAGRRLHATGDETYKNTFRCVPDEVAYRPARRRRELQQVAETATVVGPPGEEIHVDELGRVKVQFHWDLEGRRDEKASCWLRVAQPWAGTGWGHQFIPRIGMEVLVTFLGGDVDRPAVTGAVFNAANPPPYPLPAQKTRSGIRTRSTPGGGGANELRFEDAASKEQIYLHAQRDLDELIENDHTRTVRRDETISIGRGSKVDIGGDQELSVQGNEVVTIQKNLVLHVVGRQIIHVDGQGAGDGEGSEATAPEPEAAAPAPDTETGASEGVEQLAEQEALRAKVASAKMLFWREQLPDEHYARGKELVASVEGAAERLAALEAGPSGEARSDEAKALRDAVGKSIAAAIEPAPAALHRLQVAVIEELQRQWMRADAIEKGLALGPRATGSAKGGGGGEASRWSKTEPGQPSTLKISNGPGVIDASAGFTIATEGSTIDMTRDSTTISAQGSTVKVTPSAITLSCGSSTIEISKGQIKIDSPLVLINS